jgi:hypothetical protein
VCGSPGNIWRWAHGPCTVELCDLNPSWTTQEHGATGAIEYNDLSHGVVSQSESAGWCFC